MLTERQRQILSVVVSEFVNSAAPVSSLGISKIVELSVSSATIRNELGALEELGYITHPHTSAGRLPTDKGYRYFVDHLLEHEAISRDMAIKVAGMFRERVQSVDELMRKASKLLSSLTQEASLIVFPKLESQHFKKVTLISVDELHLVVVWISTTGLVWHGAIELESPVDAEALDLLVNFLNKELAGLSFHKIENFLTAKLRERRDSLAKLHDIAMRVVKESLKVSQELRLFLDGSKNVLEKPEFEDAKKSRRLFGLFDSKKDLLRIFDESIRSEGLKVSIGTESRFVDISDCALVTSTYQMKDDSAGILGVLGPKRMNYSKVISLVEYMAEEMAEVLSKNF
ncbi:MAG: heat-inducible transcription repressor HrcA [Candidatus Omnitrophica bacterium]|nr:heat-inducible transcription repressor HrcA [Candidatus Omnitrophota bacterium]